MLRFPFLIFCLPFVLHCQNFGNFWDESSEKKPAPASAPKRIFLHTSPSISSSLGGIAGADTVCNTSGQRPDMSVSYAAMIADGVTRQACTNPDCSNPSENIGWVLKPNTVYLQASGTVQIGVTNGAGIFSFPLDAAFSATSGFFIHGLNSDWTTGSTCIGSGGLWTGTMSGGSASGGQAGSPTITALQNGTVGCTSGTNYLLCVEQ